MKNILIILKKIFKFLVDIIRGIKTRFIVFFKINGKEILRFIVSSGGIGVFFGLITLICLKELSGTRELLASTISCVMAYTIGFVIQKFWVFKNNDIQEILKQILWFVVTSIPLLLLNYWFMRSFVEHYHIHYIISQVITSPIICVLSYVTSKVIIFKKK
jgi:putative flippase GtrA